MSSVEYECGSAVLALLRELEWRRDVAGMRWDCLPMCPVCHGTKNAHPSLAVTQDIPLKGHKRDCRFAKVLEGAGADVEWEPPWPTDT
jgi:succinate dehydrogenase/fumarate reductase-like Fe-S protein